MASEGITSISSATDFAPLLRIHNLSVGYGARTILHRVNLTAPSCGLMALMGPSGGGKSTLLRTIGRWNDTQPDFWAKGEVYLNGTDVLHTTMIEHVHQRIPMLAQKARLYTGSVLDNATVGVTESPPTTVADWEHLAYQVFQPLGLWEEFAPFLHTPVMALSMAAHKKILMARLLARQAACFLVDEPLRDIAVAEEAALITLLERIAQRHLVLMVTHSKTEARRLCDRVCFITGHTIVEVTPAEEFFTSPRTALGREFLRSGSCWPQPDDALPEAPVAPIAMTPIRPPREFHWVLMGLLGGMQYPGLLGDVDEDLDGLRSLGVRWLVSLTETPFDIARLQAFGIDGMHYPIRDMSVPTLSQAETMCQHIAAALTAQQPTVLHCKAGLGRTGTMLACVLVYRGMDAMRAIETVRMVKPGYIQTEEQWGFVSDFATHLRQ